MRSRWAFFVCLTAVAVGWLGVVQGGDAAHLSRPRCSTPVPHEDCFLVAQGLTNVIADPAEPQIIVALNPGGDEWLSRDGGQAWRAVKLGNWGWPQTGDPPNPEAWAITNDGTLVSVFFPESSVSSSLQVVVSHDLGESWENASCSGLSSCPQGLLVADPAEPEGLWACTNSPDLVESGGIAHSEDAGVTWSLVHSFGAQTGCDTVALEPGGSVILAAVTPQKGANELFRSTDSGQTWQKVAGIHPSNEDDVPTNTLAFDPTRPQVVLVLTTKGVRRSTNAGATWQSVRMPQRPKPCAYHRVAFAGNGEAVVVGNASHCATTKDGGSGTIWASSNYGASWKRLRIPPTPISGEVWDFNGGETDGNPDPAMALIPDGKRILFYASQLLIAGPPFWAPAPFWRLSLGGRAMNWYGSWKAASS